LSTIFIESWILSIRDWRNSFVIVIDRFKRLEAKMIDY